MNEDNRSGNSKKYEVIYADPPWAFRVRSEKGKGRSAECHYPTMKLEDICALPVREITAEDSILFMWATFPNLREAFDVIDAWGFTYKTVAFVWVKRYMIITLEDDKRIIQENDIKIECIPLYKFLLDEKCGC